MATRYKIRSSKDISDAALVVLGNTSNVNSGDQTTIAGITGTKAQFDTAVTDGNFMYVGDAPTSHTHALSEVTDSTTEALGVGSLEVGHASDTTITRVSAGVIAVEGVTIPTISSTNTLTNKTLTDAKIPTTENAQTGTTYTLVLTDASKYVSMSNASANTLTVPLNSSVAFPVGTKIMVQQRGAGSTTIAATGGVTINVPTSAPLAIAEQYGSRGLYKTATDTWQLI